MMVAGLTYDENRLARMELTGIYWNEGDQGVLVKKGAGASYNSAESFAGKTVAAQNGTNQQIMAEEQLPESTTVELVTKIPDGVNMVKTGRIDGLVVPKTVYDSILAENDDLEVADFAFDFQGRQLHRQRQGRGCVHREDSGDDRHHQCRGSLSAVGGRDSEVISVQLNDESRWVCARRLLCCPSYKGI